MREIKKAKSKEVTDDTKIRYAIDFIEEMSWLLDAKKNLKLSEIPNILRSKLVVSDATSKTVDGYISPNPNIHYLIGVLPRLFQDIKLFSRNEDIAEFANEVLGIAISRVEKRSKYELIGLIVCEANDLDDTKLASLVNALSLITGNSEKLDLMIKEKSSVSFSWNETIRKIGAIDE
ncbi:hypothetical protein C6380_20045 [Pseudomonas syringae pv. actinidiae]|uniref:hypothetical protein n=1 Tax=Pseudomonas syringae TaxID=317 RepID=UPI000BB56461|nr:hypothetical protein [Pseudomonas syringae]PBK48889.1 hypothetical protein BUE60_25775 [Pseudomonas syringae pv. actinidiae]PBK53355.1 hypothetical protein BUE61_12515 [Pseudomonas syringae pv. actinidiae]RJX51353.1 hypothetical protein C6379_21765 [Pseudomonas syringae pv. actinidiae]RJX52993.1 hypothetical protein C6380_20045 [Pseudomonas syringae pv. actinidiae]RJX59578.1 hypothetical protein C6383_15220 [Pseudomonas syringae pv. actinidiae]